MKMGFKTEGFAEMQKVLAEMPNAVRNRVTMNALRAGGRVLRAEMKLKVPKKTGELNKSINVTTYTSRKAGERAVAVGVRGKEGPLAHLVEFGTAPHPIKPKKGKVLAYVDGGQQRFAAAVKHPGAKPHPFVRPATDTKGKEAVERIRDNMGAGIIREAEKLASSTGSRRRK